MFDLNEIKPFRIILSCFLVLYLSTGYLLIYIFNFDEFVKLEFFKITFLSISFMGSYLIFISIPIVIIMMYSIDIEKGNDIVSMEKRKIKANISTLLGFFLAYVIFGIILISKFFFDIQIKTAIILSLIYLACMWIIGIAKIFRREG